MGTAIALRERCPGVPGTPNNRNDLVDEVRCLVDKLNVETILEGLKAGVQLGSTEKGRRKAQFYILTLDAQKRITKVKGYAAQHLSVATQDYIDMEKTNADKPEIQAVLVSVDSVAGLRKAYPNYYLDTSRFQQEVKTFIADDKSKNWG